MTFDKDQALQFVAFVNGKIVWVTLDALYGRVDHDLLPPTDRRYVRAWKPSGLDTWQVCFDGSNSGDTLTWRGATTADMARNFAHDVGAKFYTTAGGMSRAIARVARAPAQ